MSSPLKQLIAGLNEAFSAKSWHGTNLKGSLRGLKWDEAAWRPAPDRHNIWELVVHAAYWKYVVRRRITGERRGGFPIAGSNWFSRSENLSERVWLEDVHLLESTHETLLKEVEKLDDQDLDRVPPGGKYPVDFLLRGVIAHDLYHAGQIQLLKRIRTSVASEEPTD